MSLSGLGEAFRGWTLLAILAVFSIAALFMPLVESFGQLGFDFRGTLWEPARAIIDGSSMYPEPTRAAMELGTPAVLALLPAGAAPWLWLLLLAGGCRLAMSGPPRSGLEVRPAVPRPPLPGGRLGGRVSRGARARGVGARRLRGAPRLPSLRRSHNGLPWQIVQARSAI